VCWRNPCLFPATNDANQQISDMENFIGAEPDAIVIEPLGRAASVAVIERAIDAASLWCCAPMHRER